MPGSAHPAGCVGSLSVTSLKNGPADVKGLVVSRMDEPNRRTRFWLAAAALASCVGLSIALCGFVLGAPLVSDDWVLLDAAAHKGAWGAWGGGGHEMLGFFRPLVTVSLWANWKLGGLNPVGYHLFNAAVHGLCAWLAFMVLAALLERAGVRPGGFHTGSEIVPLFFLIHPSHAEPVAWVSGRGDLMACAFSLAALLAWIAAGGRQRPAALRALSLALFVLGLLAKESAVVVPVIILAYELILVNAGRWHARVVKAVRRVWPLFAVLLVLLAIRAETLGHAVGGYGSGRILALHPAAWARNVAVALLRSFLPAIPTPGLQGAGAFSYSAAMLVLMAGLALYVIGRLVKSRRQPASPLRPVALFCAAAALIALLPVTNLPVSLRSTEGERFVYLPSAFSVMLLAMGLGVFSRKLIERASFVICILYFFGFSLSLNLWADAGRLAGRLVADLGRIAEARKIEEIEIYNLPDHLRGAYVFRNGFVEAARMNGIGPEKIENIKVVNVVPVHDVMQEFMPQVAKAKPATISVNYSEGCLRAFSR